MTAKKSWLQTHPHIKRFTYVVMALIVAFVLVSMFGRETVKEWIEGAARSVGYEITEEVTP